MNREKLAESAKKIKQPPQKVRDEYSEKREKITAELNDVMINRKDLDKLIGEDNKQMMPDNHKNHAMFME